MISLLALCAAAVATWALMPELWLGAVIAAGLVWFVLQCLHLDAAVREPELTHAGSARPPRSAAAMPLVSIHVPTYDEPPALVIETLKSLLALDYPRFEVIVLDNNTPHAETWQPVARFCAKHPEVLRFFHVDGVRGAKAGALNLCLDVMNPQAELIAVVDADYIVSSHFLKVGVEALQRSDASFVQFPQSYRGVTPDIEPIAAELEDYFNAFARRANDTRSMLLTGTLSLIKVDALIDVGGWNAVTVTEDAELGLRMFAAGHQGLFVDNIAGRGLLPLDFASLRVQRERWVCGNVQTMTQAVSRHLGAFSRRGVKSVITQLTAWPALLAVPIAVVLLGALPLPPSEARAGAVTFAALAVLAALVVTAIRMAITVSVRGQPLHLLFAALAVKWSLVWCSSVCWIKALTSQSLPFIKTPKSVALAGSRPIPNSVLTMLALVALGSYLSHGNVLASLACLSLAATAPAAVWVDAKLSGYRPDAVISEPIPS